MADPKELDAEGWRLLVDGHVSEAQVAFTEAVSGYRNLIHEGQSQYFGHLFRVITARANTLVVLNQTEAARDGYDEAIGGLFKLCSKGETEWLGDRYWALSGQARMLHFRGDVEASVTVFDLAIRGFASLVSSGERKWLGNLAQTLSIRAELLAYLQKHDLARKGFEEALECYFDLAEDERGLWESEIVWALTGRATVLNSVGQHERSLEAFDFAVDCYKRLIEDGYRRLRANLLLAQHARTQSLRSLDRMEASCQACDEIIVGYRALIAEGEKHWEAALARAQADRAKTLFTLGHLNTADEEYVEAIANYERLIADGQMYLCDDVIRAQEDRALLMVASGSWFGALILLRTSIAFSIKHRLIHLPQQMAAKSAIAWHIYASTEYPQELGAMAGTDYMDMLRILDSYLASYQYFMTDTGSIQEAALPKFWGDWITIFRRLKLYELVLDAVARAHCRRTAAQAMTALFLRKVQIDPDQAEYVKLSEALHKVELELIRMSAADSGFSGLHGGRTLGGTDIRYDSRDQILRDERRSLGERLRHRRDRLIADRKLPDVIAWERMSGDRLKPGSDEALALWVVPEELGRCGRPYMLLATQGGIKMLFDKQGGLDLVQAYKMEQQLACAMLSGRCARDAGNATFAASAYVCKEMDVPSVHVSDEQLRTFLTQTVWKPLLKRCAILKVKTLHMITSGRLHSLPWQGSAPNKGPALHIHPGVFAYVKHQDANVQESPCPSVQRKLLVLVHEAADEPERRLYCIPLEIAFLQTIWGDDAVRVVADVPVDTGAYAGLICLGHGGFDAKSGQAGLDLGPDTAGGRRMFNQAAMTLDGNDYPHMEASACVLGHLLDIGNEPCGLIATALTKPAVSMAMGALLPVDDLLAALRTLLCHALWGSGATLRESAHGALACLESGDWPLEAIETLRHAMIRTLPDMAKAMEQDGHKLRMQGKDTARIDRLRLDLTLDGSPQRLVADTQWKRLVHAVMADPPLDHSPIVQQLSTLIATSLPAIVKQRDDLLAFTRYWMIC